MIFFLLVHLLFLLTAPLGQAVIHPPRGREKKIPVWGQSERLQSQAASTSKSPVMAIGNPRVVFWWWCWMVEWGLGMRRISCQPIPDRFSCTMRIRVESTEYLLFVFAYFFFSSYRPCSLAASAGRHTLRIIGKREVHEREGKAFARWM